jgi:hypothetical protein
LNAQIAGQIRKCGTETGLVALVSKESRDIKKTPETMIARPLLKT